MTENDIIITEHKNEVSLIPPALKPKRPRRDSVAAAKRQQTVFELLSAGFKIPQIADQLGVNERTIDRDIEAMNKEYARQFESFDKEAFIGTLNQRSLERMRQLKNIILDGKINAANRIRALVAIAQEDERLEKRMQDAGKLTKAADVQIDNSTSHNQIIFNLIKPEKKDGDNLGADTKAV